MRPSRQDSARSAACLPACVQESSLTLVLCIFPPPVKVSNPTAQIGVLGSQPSPCQYYDWPLRPSINTDHTHSPPMTGLDPFAPPRQTLTLTGLGKMAPLRVTMTDLVGTRLRPELPGTTETSPPLLPLGLLQRAPGRTAIRASRQATADAIFCSAPRRDPHPTHPVWPSRRKPASKPRETLGTDAQPLRLRSACVPVAVGKPRAPALRGDVRSTTTPLPGSGGPGGPF